ncbi:MAG: hypothetical protein OEZ59_06280 [Deltaproteobacteria bacterium]|nr:hypothetical protein [Deltaproteobacteria bacterium]
MSNAEMKIHTIGINNYSIIGKQEKGRVWMLQFAWGKKDFRVYLGAQGEGPDIAGMILEDKSGQQMTVTRLEYLYNYEWFNYGGTAGHGIASEEVRWTREEQRRYLELPKDFLFIAAQLSCLEFGLKILERRKAG